MIKKGIKIKVTPEQSKQIQQICFDNGVFWRVAEESTVKNLDKPYLFIDEKGVAYCREDGEDYFKNHNNIEVSADLFIKTNGTCIYDEVIKNKFMKLIDKRNKANEKLKKFAKRYNLEELI